MATRTGESTRKLAECSVEGAISAITQEYAILQRIRSGSLHPEDYFTYTPDGPLQTPTEEMSLRVLINQAQALEHYAQIILDDNQKR